MAYLVRKIAARGHDVQLHTHPAWPFSEPSNTSFFGPETYSYGVHSAQKFLMCQYNLEEQVAMLREGIEKLVEWTGEKPVAHRAGAYGANYDTLAALAVVGIPIDASMLWNHPKWCRHLNDPVLTKNSVVSYSRNRMVFEIPITVFQLRRQYAFGPLKVNSRRINTCQLDIDWQSIETLKATITALNQSGVNPITLFLHSWTFVDHAGSWGTFDVNAARADTEDIAKFDTLLAWIVSHPDWKVSTMKDLSSLLANNQGALFHSDDVPIIEERIGYIDMWVIATRARTWKATAFISMHVVLILMVGLVVVRRMRKQKRSPAGKHASGN